MQKPELLSQEAGRSAAGLVYEMSRLYYLSRAIHVAAELGIADRLAEEPVALEELAAGTGANAAALGRLLRFLTAYGVFQEGPSERFSNTTLSLVLREDHPHSVRANLRRVEDSWWSAAGELEHAVRTGEAAFTHVHGMPFFQYMKANAEAQKRFDDGMARYSDAHDAAIAGALDFTRFGRIVDVGGGRGGLLRQILLRVPDAQGVLFEQPQVVQQVSGLEEADPLSRAELVAGDFFEAVPAGGDCYVIKGVLHDFDDAQCVRILGNCRKAMRADGSVVIANQDLPSRIDGPHPNLIMDLHMMTLLGGRERSAADWSALLARAGLAPCAGVETDVGFTLIQATPV